MIIDVIGDIHGYADKLTGLLRQLGYQHNGQYFAPPPNHRALFIGDLIDRGSQQVETLEIVFAMLDADVADAVMGNHEYNALAYATLDPDNEARYLRSHNDAHSRQHEAFLAEIPFGSALHQYWLKRLYELPLWLEIDAACFVHACWDRGWHRLGHCIHDCPLPRRPHRHQASQRRSQASRLAVSHDQSNHR